MQEVNNVKNSRRAYVLKPVFHCKRLAQNKKNKVVTLRVFFKKHLYKKREAQSGPKYKRTATELTGHAENVISVMFTEENDSFQSKLSTKEIRNL